MVSAFKEEKKKRIRVSISEKDVEKIWGKEAPLALVQHWINIGRDRYNHALKSEAQIELLAESIQKLEEELLDLKSEIKKSTDLLLQTSKLINIYSTVAQYDLEVIKARKKAGVLTEHEASKNLLSEIKEENFDRFVAENFPGKSANKFLSTTTKH